MNNDRAVQQLHADLGLKRLNRVWAKGEILLGLTAAGIGLLLGGWAVNQPSVSTLHALGGLLLFVLGGYLTLAGNRSHLYQSNNELVAYLAELIRRPEQP